MVSAGLVSLFDQDSSPTYAPDAAELFAGTGFKDGAVDAVADAVSGDKNAGQAGTDDGHAWAGARLRKLESWRWRMNGKDGFDALSGKVVDGQEWPFRGL